MPLKANPACLRTVESQQVTSVSVRPEAAKCGSLSKVVDAGVPVGARAEGILPAPEASHAVKGAIDEVIRCRLGGVSRAILFNLCGRGYFDMQAYIDYFAGKLQDLDYDEAKLAMALAGLPSVPTRRRRYSTL
jgi:hypothetical protein